MKFILFFLTSFFIFTTSAQAEVLFEGYYKVSQFNKHIGFAILRHELDSKTKNFKSTQYLKLAKNGFDLTESLQTTSDSDLRPINYTYISTDGKSTKTIDAQFSFKGKDGKMTALITENGEKKKKDKKISSDTFLASALYYFMLKSKTGIKVDTKYDYTAVAEELFEASKGVVRVEKKLVSEGPFQLMKAENDFASSKYTHLISDRGEVISGNTPATGIELKLVKTSAEATEGVKVSAGTLEKIFGEVPAGKINLYGK